MYNCTTKITNFFYSLEVHQIVVLSFLAIVEGFGIIYGTNGLLWIYRLITYFYKWITGELVEYSSDDDDDDNHDSLSSIKKTFHLPQDEFNFLKLDAKCFIRFIELLDPSTLNRLILTSKFLYQQCLDIRTCYNFFALHLEYDSERNSIVLHEEYSNIKFHLKNPQFLKCIVVENKLKFVYSRKTMALIKKLKVKKYKDLSLCFYQEDFKLHCRRVLYRLCHPNVTTIKLFIKKKINKQTDGNIVALDDLISFLYELPEEIVNIHVFLDCSVEGFNYSEKSKIRSTVLKDNPRFRLISADLENYVNSTKNVKDFRFHYKRQKFVMKGGELYLVFKMFNKKVVLLDDYLLYHDESDNLQDREIDDNFINIFSEILKQ